MTACATSSSRLRSAAVRSPRCSRSTCSRLNVAENSRRPLFLRQTDSMAQPPQERKYLVKSVFSNRGTEQMP
jgi:hypothetical protein